MITLAIGAILIASAAPGFRWAVQNNRSVTQVNELLVSLNLARSEAIKRNDNLTVCRSSNGTACSTVASWENGWIVFVDNNADGTVNGADEILRVQGSLSGNNSLSYSQTRVTFASSGLATSGSNGTFTLCDSRGAAYSKGLIIGPTGHPYNATDSDSNGIPEDFNGDDLVCS